jgi:hypothetical protein
MNGRVLIKAITEIDGRLVQAEVYVELGQSVAPIVKDGKLSLTVKCEGQTKPVPMTIVDRRSDKAVPLRYTISKASDGTVRVRLVAEAVEMGEVGPEVVLPLKRDRLTGAVENWLPHTFNIETDYHWVSAKRGERVDVEPKKLTARALDDASKDIGTWLAEKIADRFAREQDKPSAGTGVRKPTGPIPYPPGVTRESLAKASAGSLRGEIRRVTHDALASGTCDRLMNVRYGVTPAVTPTPTSPVPTAIRVLFDGYPIPHAIACHEAEGWVDVLLFTEDGVPIWDAARKAWKAERLEGRVQRIKDQT